MNNLPDYLGTAFVGLGGIGALGIMLRKFFVNWSKENVVVQGADTTAMMMQNFHVEIKRLSAVNDELAKENRSLQKQIGRLEAILEKIAVTFNVDINDFDSDANITEETQQSQP